VKPDVPEFVERVAPVLGESSPDSSADGLVLTGTFLGVKWSAPYEIDGRKGVSRPKLGLEVDGEDVAIEFREDAALRIAVDGLGWERGVTRLWVSVEVRPPFDRGKRVRYFARGQGPQSGRGGWE